MFDTHIRYFFFFLSVKGYMMISSSHPIKTKIGIRKEDIIFLTPERVLSTNEGAQCLLGSRKQSRHPSSNFTHIFVFKVLAVNFYMEKRHSYSNGELIFTHNFNFRRVLKFVLALQEKTYNKY